MPIEVARLAWQSAFEPDHRTKPLPRPFARKPYVKAAHHQEQKCQIARSRNCFCRGSILHRSAEPPVPIRDYAKEVSQPLRALSDDLSGIRSQLNRAFPAVG